MPEPISPSNLQVGHSYLKTYSSGFTLFTVTKRSINPENFKYTTHDYYYSGNLAPSTDTFTPSDFASNVIYPLPSALSSDQVKSLYPELFI